MALRLIILGPPGSGKGTQGRRLATIFGLDYLSTGALLREAVESGSTAGAEAEPFLDRGDYVPDALMRPMVEAWLAERPGGWILDGYPRTLAQDDSLREWLRLRKQGLDAAIGLEAPEEELVQRIRRRVECPECRWSGQRHELNRAGRCPECGGVVAARADDSVANSRSRHAEFDEHTVPAAERYRREGRLISCDATAPVEVVAARLQTLCEELGRNGQAA